MSPTKPPIPIAAAEKAARLFREAGGTLRAASSLRAGIHPRTLHAMLEARVIDRVSRGIYRLTDASLISNPDLVVVAHKAPTAVVCLISALAFHGITTQIPHMVDIAVAPGARTPKLEHPPVRVYRFGGKSLTEGVEKHTIDGTPVRIFSAAKTVADCFKFRNRIGIEVAVEALRDHLRKRGKNVDELIRFAEIDRVRKVMMPTRRGRSSCVRPCASPRRRGVGDDGLCSPAVGASTTIYANGSDRGGRHRSEPRVKRAADLVRWRPRYTMTTGSPFQQVRDEIGRFARDAAHQDQLRALMDRAEVATTPDALRPLITQAIAIMKKSVTDASCEENCQTQYDNCVASCTDTSCITRCFGRYILCMRGCQS